MTTSPKQIRIEAEKHRWTLRGMAYVKTTYRSEGETQDGYIRIECADERTARAEARKARNVPSSAKRIDVCQTGGRILAAWDKINGKWQKTL